SSHGFLKRTDRTCTARSPPTIAACVRKTTALNRQPGSARTTFQPVGSSIVTGAFVSKAFARAPSAAGAATAAATNGSASARLTRQPYRYAPPRGRRGLMGAIRLERVNKVYAGGVHAVHDVDLDIGAGEFMVLVGPSGCGKSTLLRMIAGLEEVTSGSISIGDQDVTNLSPRQRDVAMVFQNYALYPHMTVERNLGYGLRVRHMPKDEIRARVTEVAKLLGLEDLLDRRPAALSGGQRQRVAMGRAIVREPSAFLMDEPLSNLDAKLRGGMRDELARLHGRLDVTTVYVTHDQVEAMTLGQR